MKNFEEMVNSVVGKKYNSFAFEKNKKEEVNCFGLVRMIDQHFDDFASEFISSNRTKRKRFLDVMVKYYYEIKLEEVEKGDILLSRDRGESHYTHISKAINKNYMVHAVTNVGVSIINTAILSFGNKKILALRRKNKK